MSPDAKSDAKQNIYIYLQLQAGSILSFFLVSSHKWNFLYFSFFFLPFHKHKNVILSPFSEHFFFLNIFIQQYENGKREHRKLFCLSREYRTWNATKIIFKKKRIVMHNSKRSKLRSMKRITITEHDNEWP